MAGCFVRLYWMIVGFSVAVLCGVSIGNHQGGFSVVDAIYWAALLGALVARYVDMQKFAGRRADGAPMTLADWKRFSLIVLAAGLIGWVCVHWVRFQGLL